MDIRYIKLIYADGHIRWYIEVRRWFIWYYWTDFNYFYTPEDSSDKALRFMKKTMKSNPLTTQLNVHPTMEYYLNDKLL